MSVNLCCHLCSPPSSMECDEQQLTDAKHKQHLRMKHLGEYKPYKCNHCQEQFAVQRSLKGHAVRKHNDQSAQLQTSNESKYLEVLGQVMMQFNLNASHDDREESMVQLANSIQQKTAPSEKASSQKPANASSEMKNSKLTHSCEFCSKSFNQLKLLRTHQDKIHNLVSKGAHKCDRCRKRFHYRCHLLKHQRKEKRKPGKRPAPNLYKCLSCEVQFSSHVPRHVATFHIKKGVVKCSKCDHSDFWSTGNIRAHINYVHNGEGDVIDERASIAEEIEHLANRIVKKADDTPYGYYPKMKKYKSCVRD